MTTPATTPEDSRQDRSDESGTPAPTATTTDTPNEPSEPAATPKDDAPSREAARYRRRLRETEAQRDAALSRLEAMQRAEVERLATLPNPALLWDAGTDLADLLAEDGTVDPDKVQATVDQVAERYGVEQVLDVINGVPVRPGPRSSRVGRNSRPPGSVTDPMARVIRGE